MTAVLVSAKVSVFYSKIKKHRIYKLFITKQVQKARNKNKIGLPPNKRYRLTPLARHKSKDRSRYCHLW